MKQVGLAVLLAASVCSTASVCSAQEPGDFKPATTNVWGAEYPRVDGAGRVEVRLKAPEATKVRLNFWSGPKVDMEKQADGFWTITTPPLVPGLHYYTLIVDGVGDERPRQPRVLRRRQARERRRGPGGGRRLLRHQGRAPRPGARGLVRLEGDRHAGVTRWSTCRRSTTAETKTRYPGALPAARRRRGRDRLDPAGTRELHPRQPDRGRKLQADDRRDGVRLRAARRRGPARPDREAVRLAGDEEGHAGHGGGVRGRRDAGPRSRSSTRPTGRSRTATTAPWPACRWAACRRSRSR